MQHHENAKVGSIYSWKKGQGRFQQSSIRPGECIYLLHSNVSSVSNSSYSMSGVRYKNWVIESLNVIMGWID